MSDKTQKKIKTKASDMLVLAILAYLALQVQPVIKYLIVMTPLIDNLPLNDKLWTLILNTLCVAAWFGLGFWFVRMSKNECGYQVIRKEDRPSTVRLCVAGAVAVAFIAPMLIFAGGFLFPYKIQSVLDVLYTAAYYVFLVANAGMMVLVVAFGQKFGDIAFGGRLIPWGGITLGAFMAVTNLISGFSSLDGGSPWGVLVSAAVVFAYALVYGVIYIAVERKPLYALPFVAFIFVLI